MEDIVNNTFKNRELIKQLIKEELREILKEGIDLDKPNLTVSFNPNHQNYVDTNDPWNPKPIYNYIDDYKIISIFSRKLTKDKRDGNPLIYALKGKDWQFKHPKYDILALLRRFVAVTKELKEEFDTIITIPSSNSLNTEILHKIIRILKYDKSFEDFFIKYTADEVYDDFIDSNWLKRNYPDIKERKAMHSRIYSALEHMNDSKEFGGNDGIFSYKFIKPVELRDAIIQSMHIRDNYIDTLEYGKYINDKNVLIIDDTVTTGNTLSDSAEAIKATYDPKSITFLTLFSPLEQRFKITI